MTIDNYHLLQCFFIDLYSKVSRGPRHVSQLFQFDKHDFVDKEQKEEWFTFSGNHLPHTELLKYFELTAPTFPRKGLIWRSNNILMWQTPHKDRKGRLQRQDTSKTTFLFRILANKEIKVLTQW